MNVHGPKSPKPAVGAKAPSVAPVEPSADPTAMTLGQAEGKPGLKCTHGRVGEPLEFVEFETKDGCKFFTQRSGPHFPVYENRHGALKVMGGTVPVSLQEGQAQARKLAEEHEASLARATKPDFSRLPIVEIPGVKVLPAQPGKTYSANELPSTISKDEVVWTRLGLDEEFNVILHRKGFRLEVVECVWNEASQDWDDHTVTDTAGLDLTVYLP